MPCHIMSTTALAVAATITFGGPLAALKPAVSMRVALVALPKADDATTRLHVTRNAAIALRARVLTHQKHLRALRRVRRGMAVKAR